MKSNETIERFLENNKVETKVLVFSETTRTSQDAAKQAGCELARIAKSIVFRVNDEPILVITSGPNKVSEAKLEKLVGAKIEKADAEFIYEKTGFPIGGVAAFCHKTPLKHVFIDEDLTRFEEVWSAAGTPFAIFEISTPKLIELSHAKIADIKQ